MLAVQWHPEDDAETAPHQQALFDSIVAEAELRRRRRTTLHLNPTLEG
jgi:putative glutamine amidotransferase